ncbi:recombination protein [Klebsiella phage vB_KaeS_Diencephalon]|nr:recombination protein [Klebsiella phage vB_KaeS_Diencephalon]
MQFSQPSSQIMKHFAEAQALCVSPTKSKQNTHLKNHYATIDDVLNAIGPSMENSGLIAIQSPTYQPGQPANVMLMETTIIHVPSGEWMKDICQIPLAKNDAQGFGSTVTYARRYSLVAIFGLKMNDDDGNKSVRTAADCSRSIEQAATIEDVNGIARAAAELFANDKASLRIVENARAKRVVELKNANAKPFNPGKPDKARKGSVKVAAADEAPQNAEPQPPVNNGPIEEDF